MTSHYANLEWAVERRGVDLRELSNQTTAALRAAPTDSAAKRALERFIQAFGDGHLSIRFPAASSPPAVRSVQPQPPQQQPTGVCERMGYRAQRRSGGIAFRLVPTFRSLGGADSSFFPAGVLTVGDKRVGILRISSFEDNIFPSLCERAANTLHIAPDSNCADGCAGPLDRETGNEMGRALARQLALLQAQNISLLVVDITVNGGGTNWVEVAARMLSPRPLMAPRQGFIRHPHHVQQLQDAIAGMVKDSANARGAATITLGRALATLRLQAREARTPCNRSMLWNDEQPGCKLVFTEPVRYSTGLLRYAAPGSVPKLTDCCALYYPSRYSFQESAYRGPLAVMVDNNTASAAEYFAAMLADNHVATILGIPTDGSGCGYTNGGVPVRLKFSNAEVKMPDCVRFRADSTNEVEGVTPDVLIPWRLNDSPLQRARRAVEAISGL